MKDLPVHRIRAEHSEEYSQRSETHLEVRHPLAIQNTP